MDNIKISKDCKNCIIEKATAIVVVLLFLFSTIIILMIYGVGRCIR